MLLASKIPFFLELLSKQSYVNICVGLEFLKI